MPSPVILFYSPAPVPYASRLLSLCAVQGIRLRVVEAAGLDRPLSALAQGLDPEGPLSAGEPLPEPMLIFCHCPEPRLDRVLAGLRKLRISCLKAVLTPTNSQWTLRALYGELCRERFQLGGAHPTSS